MIRISIRIPDRVPQIFETEELRVTIGRSSANLLALENPHISSQHAYLVLSSLGATMTDRGSTNGTMIRRRGVDIAVPAGGKEVPIAEGDILILGDSADPVTLEILALAAESPFDADTETDISTSPVALGPVGEVVARWATGEPINRLDIGDSGVEAFVTWLDAIGQADATQLIEAASSSLLSLCPAASHLYLCFRDKDHASGEEVHLRTRGGAEGKTRWRPTSSLATRVRASGEAWLVAQAGIEVEGSEGPTLVRVPHAICAPLLNRGDVEGFLFLDDRASSRHLEQRDLALVATLAMGMTRALALCRLSDLTQPQATLAQASASYRAFVARQRLARHGGDCAATARSLDIDAEQLIDLLRREERS